MLQEHPSLETMPELERSSSTELIFPVNIKPEIWKKLNKNVLTEALAICTQENKTKTFHPSHDFIKESSNLGRNATDSLCSEKYVYIESFRHLFYCILRIVLFLLTESHNCDLSALALHKQFTKHHTLKSESFYTHIYSKNKTKRWLLQWDQAWKTLAPHRSVYIINWLYADKRSWIDVTIKMQYESLVKSSVPNKCVWAYTDFRCYILYTWGINSSKYLASPFWQQFTACFEKLLRKDPSLPPLLHWK